MAPPVTDLLAVTATEAVAVAVIMGVTGLFLLWMGRRLRRTHDVTLVAGYRRDEVEDEAGLAELVGAVTAVTGVATVVVGLVHPFVSTAGRIALWAVYFAVTVALAFWAHRRGRQYVVEE